MTKLGVFCERFLEAGWLVAIATTPLYFNLYSSRVFEPDKITMLRSIVVVMALAQLVKWVDDWHAGRASPGRGGISANGAGHVQPMGLLGWWAHWSASNPLGLPTALVVVSYLLGTLVSAAPAISLWGSYQRLQGTYSMFAYITLFALMAANLRRRAQIERIFTAVLLVSLPISLYAVVQHQRLDPLPWGGDVSTRATSTLGNPIFLGAYLIMVIPIALQRLVGSVMRLRRFGEVRDDELYRGWPQVLSLAAMLIIALAMLVVLTTGSATKVNLWWATLPAIAFFVALTRCFTIERPTYLTTLAELVSYALLLLLQLTALVLTQSRGPQIGFLVGIWFFLMVLAIRHRSRALIGAFGAMGIAGLLFLVAFNVPNSPLGSLKQVPFLGRLGTVLEGDTGKVRLLIWEGTKQLIETRPGVGPAESDPLGPARLLFGYGPESMYVVYNKVYPAALANIEARNATPDRNHNDILDHVINVGFLGLSAYVFLLVAAFRLLWRHLWRAPGLPEQLPFIAILAAIVAHIVESQVGIVIAATRTYLWAYLAIIAAGGLLYRQAPATPASASESTAEFVATGRPGVAFAAPVASGRPTGRRRNRRSGHSGAAQWPADGRPDALGDDAPGTGVSVYPRLAWLALALLLAIVMLWLSGMPPAQDAQLPLRLSFFGLVGSMVFIACVLPGWPKTRRSGSRWAHAIAYAGILPAAYIIALNLNVVAADIYYKRGFAADQSRQFGLAVPEYNKALALAGTEDYYYLFLGRAYLELSRSAPAQQSGPPFEPTIQKLRSLSTTQLSALSRDDLLNASRVVLEEAHHVNPLNTDHAANLGRLYRMWAELGDPSKLEKADEYYREATTLRPNAAHLWWEWGVIDVVAGKQQDALQKGNTAIQIDPAFPNSYVLVGDMYQEAGKLQEALEAHSKAAAIDPATLLDPRFEQRLGAYEKAAMIPQVETIFAKAVQVAPNSPQLHAAYGYILSRQGKAPEALIEFQANVRLAPNDWIAHRNLALVYQALGQIDQAITSAQSAQRFAPADQNASLQNLVNELQKKRP